MTLGGMQLALTAGVLAAVAGQTPWPVVSIEQGPMSGLDEPREVVIDDEAAWEALWREHAPSRPRPEVSFRTHTVVGVFLGTRSTAGFRLSITAARLADEILTVEYIERRPGAGALVAQVLTAPFHIVLIPRHTGVVRFERREAP